jgi:uncharacterized protein
MPASISQYVLKVHSRCDLSCDHCYVYQHADQSWRAKPKELAEATARQAAIRISEHARLHRLDRVQVVLHGGEPLLLGHDGLRRVLLLLRSVIDPVTRLDLRIHTNGVLLDDRLCALFTEYAVKVGVSLDGDRAANDRHRRFSDGRSSHAQVRRALALLRQAEYKHLYAGLLCTIDLENDPIAVYEALLAEAPPRLDLLFPHATWDRPPHRPAGVPAPYAAWLGQIHSRWVADGRPVPIRLFDSVLAAWEGRRSASEAAGLDPVDLLVIETDGSWEQADSLKTAFDRAPATGFNVFASSVDEVAAHPGVAGRQAGISALCPACRRCPVVRACGGGLYAHRYRSGAGFDNPSVYCADLQVLIPRITARPRTVAAAAARPGSHALSHVLAEGAFDRLAAGPGDPAAMAALAEAHWSVTRALVAAVASDLDGGPGRDLGRAAAQGWMLLSALDTERPRAVREVLTYPFVRAWATQCLRPAGNADRELDHAHLAGLAAAAALRAGIEAELVLPVRRGSIYLPSVGALAVGANAGHVSVVRVSPSGLSSRCDARGWQSVRRVAAAGMSVTVDDIDPFRDCQAWDAAGRLPAATWKSWRLALAAAAGQLAAELPAYADVIGAGLRCVVPMRSQSPGHRQSGTAPRAFGAVAVALPGDTSALAALLLHEMQHVKLAALGDLIDLFDRADSRRFAVPWRADRRPVEGVLHGTYAHLAVAELWRSRAPRLPAGPARQHFRMYRSWVEEGIEVLLNAGALTPAGKRFVNGMRETAEAWAYDW